MNLPNFMYLLLVGFITEIAFIKSFGLCINKKMNLNLIKFCLIILFTLLDSANFINNEIFIFRLSTSYLLSVILNIVLFKVNMKTALFYTTLIFIVGIACELFTTGFFLFLNISNYNELYNLNSFQMLFTTVNTMLILLFFRFLKKTKKLSSLNNIIKKNDHINLIAFILFVLLSSSLMLYSYDFYNSKTFLTVLITLIIIIAFLTTLIINSRKEDNLLARNKFLLERNKYFETVCEDYHILKHNLINDLLAIETIGNNNVKTLVRKKIKKYNKDDEPITAVKGIPKHLEGLLHLKTLNAKMKGISCHIVSNVKTKFLDDVNMNIYENICDALSILLDNAFEAAEECQEKFVYIEIKETKNRLEINIMNPFNHQVDLDAIGTKNYSTKKQKSGIGLYFLNKFVNKKNVSIKRKIINEIFISTIIVKKQT